MKLLTVRGAPAASSAIVIVPLFVSIVAVYRLDRSMHMGGGPSKRWRFSAEPSSVGHSVDMVSSPSRLGDLGDRHRLDAVGDLRCSGRLTVLADLLDHRK